ncbi:MAG TPA: tetratricopeptide repeat protein [Aromatoleum sp.]|uniref:tetratricopeptide repeat protein n=1 Tax=Aromatoleum sp. TaxID=2307007 RepID=UPI002B4A7034|nr:tetratricopeptide repeat protein [Aromatoleum sp.]HJV28697.1 tetratricopeptide repeat protein [Aromatoleum sp.]
MNRTFSKLALSIGLLFAANLQAFAAPPAKPSKHAPAAPAAAPAAPAASSEAASTPEAEAVPTEDGLTARVLYTFLLAEIAGARGQVDIAAQAYADLAERTRDPRIARRAVEVALFARNMQAATTAARIWADTEPGSDEAQRVLASLVAGGDAQIEQVEAQLARLLARSPDHIDNHLMGLNRAFSRISDKQAVRGVIVRLTEPYIDHPEAHFARAIAAVTAADADGAIAAIDVALRQRPDWEPAVLFKAQVLSQSGAMQDAVKLVKDYADRHPDSRSARLAYARALVSQRDFDGARKEFRALLAATPDDTDLMYAIGLLSAQLEDYDDAVTLLERALAGGHSEANGIRLNLGQIAERREDLERALRWYGSVEPGRHYVEAQLRIAATLAHQGKLQEARDRLRAVKADDDDRKRLLLAEAQLLRNAGQVENAFQVLDDALNATPSDSDLLYESSMLAESLGKLDLMENRLRKLISLYPDHAHAYNALGYSLADRGVRLDEAQALISHALELTPNDPFILDSMGWVQFRRSDLDAALNNLERAYGMRQDPEIAAHLGEVLWSMERRGDASRVWDEALKANPDNAALKEVVQRLRGK